MNATVFGTGIVGRVIAAKLNALGHTVTIATRNINETLSRTDKDGMGNPPFGEWYEANKAKIKLAPLAEAAQTADILFNCTAGRASVDALHAAGKQNLVGKILIDISNPLVFTKGAPPTLSPVDTDSLGEMIQRNFPELKVVKTLNTMNCFLMVDPSLVPGDHNVFMSGNDGTAKSSVKTLLNSFGWKDSNILDLGDISTARGTEQLLPIWIRLMGVMKGPMFNFKIVGTGN